MGRAGVCVDMRTSLLSQLYRFRRIFRESFKKRNLPKPMSWNVFALLDSAPDGTLACELSTVSSARRIHTPIVWGGEWMNTEEVNVVSS